MPRFVVVPALIAAVLAIFVVAGPSSGPPTAEATSPVDTAHWGDWDCSAGTGAAPASDPVPGVTTISDFMLVMALLAHLEDTSQLPPGCPSVGEAVTLTTYGLLLWGDINCDGVVNIQDAFIMLLFAGGILPGNFIDCPSVDQAIFFVLGLADFKYQSLLAQFAAASEGGVHPEFFSNYTLMAVAGLIHNNGPNNAAAADVFWTIEQLSGGNMFYRLLARPGDACLDLDDLIIPCGEGDPSDDPADSCDDGQDNDDDNVADEADSDCVQVLRLRTPVSLAAANSITLNRYLNVRCITAGPPVFKIVGQVDVDTGIVDSNTGNNGQAFTQNGPTCVLTKIPFGGQAEHGPPAPWERPDPYIPVALPQSGGRP